MQQGLAKDKELECWWCGAPIREHGTSENGMLNIGFLCDHEKWLAEHLSPKLGRKGAKPAFVNFD
ncbi:MAG: hypothetical protein JRN19_03350 [Nitrososphaerota archaeon]|nr:hypothetical protein [Nitrososphaerota archaeon]MDG7051467.1 hypothetical protein [Nitrososphaerota archaeon]